MIKSFATILIVVALSWNHVSAAPLFATKGAIFYFDEFLNRQIYLLDKSETLENHVCFRSSFLVDISLKVFYDMEKLNNIERAQLEIWLLEHGHKTKAQEVTWKKIQGKAKCSSWMLEYVFDYELPNGWDNGAKLNLLDQDVIFIRKLYELNLPESCDNEDKFKKVHRRMELDVDITIESKKKGIDRDIDITVKYCYPLKKFADVKSF